MSRKAKQIEEVFYNVIKHKISINEFENWLYEHSEIEEIYGKCFYFDLLDIDYRSKFALEELEKIIYKKIPFAYFETKRIVKYLNDIINSEGNISNILSYIYDDYCNGYTFLRFLALSYVLYGFDTFSFDMKTNVEIIDKNNKPCVKDLKRVKELIDDFKKEAIRLRGFLEKGLIKITSECEYEDYRDSNDRNELSNVESMFRK